MGIRYGTLLVYYVFMFIWIEYEFSEELTNGSEPIFIDGILNGDELVPEVVCKVGADNDHVMTLGIIVGEILRKRMGIIYGLSMDISEII